MSAGGFPYDAPVSGFTWSRCQALEARGLAHGLAVEVYDAGDMDVLVRLERAADADLVVMSRTWEAREVAARALCGVVEVFRYDVDPAPDPDAEKWAHVAAADELHLVQCDDGRRVAYPVFRLPLLWQDEGDQA